MNRILSIVRRIIHLRARTFLLQNARLFTLAYLRNSTHRLSSGPSGWQGGSLLIQTRGDCYFLLKGDLANFKTWTFTEHLTTTSTDKYRRETQHYIEDMYQKLKNKIMILLFSIDLILVLKDRSPHVYICHLFLPANLHKGLIWHISIITLFVHMKN